MKTLRIKLDEAAMEQLGSIARTIGYSSVEELVAHLLEREIARLAPGRGESPEEIRRKLQGLGYMA